MPLRCFRSPPAQNAFVPAPVMTMQRCGFGAAQKLSNAASRSSPICVFIAFATSGRFSVTSTVCSCGCSTIMVSKLLILSIACMISRMNVSIAVGSVQRNTATNSCSWRDPGQVAAGAGREEAGFRRALVTSMPRVQPPQQAVVRVQRAGRNDSAIQLSGSTAVRSTRPAAASAGRCGPGPRRGLARRRPNGCRRRRFRSCAHRSPRWTCGSRARTSPSTRRSAA